jgi:hypothetical protein
MPLDDLGGTTEFLERLATQDGRPALSFDLPEPLHDELEKRCLDPIGTRLPVDPTPSGKPLLDASRSDLVDDRFDERRLGRYMLAAELGVRLERADDGGTRALAVEVVEAHDVREQPGHSGLERVEFGERVVADAEQ